MPNTPHFVYLGDGSTELVVAVRYKCLVRVLRGTGSLQINEQSSTKSDPEAHSVVQCQHNTRGNGSVTLTAAPSLWSEFATNKKGAGRRE